MNRRNFIAQSTAFATIRKSWAAGDTGALSISGQVETSLGKVTLTDPQDNRVSDLRLESTWKHRTLRATLTNKGTRPVRVKEVILFETGTPLSAQTELYGESFQMLSQTAGTVGSPHDLGYNEVRHYRVPGPKDATVVTSLVMLSPPGEQTTVIAYTSCEKFLGRFYLRHGMIQGVVDTENLVLAPGERWNLETLTWMEGSDRNFLLSQVAERITEHHPPLLWKKPPTGWCSYYAYGTKFTAQQVMQNVSYIADRIPQLTYAQVDDGYQPWMGDWLDTVPVFGEDIGLLLKQIRDAGQEPALWIGPFIADPQSNVFRQHPHWFIHDDEGNPLQTLNVTFGGWGRQDWYALDGTHPEVQQHLENIFRYMREEWNCRYFKLDANFWGAMHGGHFYDLNATRVDAYRRGMKAIRRGAGEDSFLLGCNHPIWPSLGLIHGSRSSADIARDWKTVEAIATQTMHRNWQNGTLWWNDPDAVCLTGDLNPDEFLFHATAAYASGGMVLSGDDLTTIPPARLAMLMKLLPPTGISADFDDSAMEIGRVRLAGATMVCAFNRDDVAKTISISLKSRCRISDYWTDEDLGEHEGHYVAKVPAHSARLLRCM